METVTAFDANVVVPEEERALPGRRETYAELVRRLSHQSVVKHFDAYADIDWDAEEYRIDPDDPRWELGCDDVLGGTAWYRGQFPLRNDGRIAGEASPGYLFHPLAPERVRETVPDAKLIVLLRDPVDRALSHYHHEAALGREPLSFEDAIDAEPERTRGEEERLAREPGYFSHAWWNYTYRARGLYADQLERWLAVFPREQLLVVPSDDLSADPGAAYASVLAFLGAAPHRLDSYPRVFERQYEPMAPETRAKLAAEFAEPNRRLYELLGRDFGWQGPEG